tara:strand:+ start:5750 stop:7138 length:1389 start_codon:yes stop_codon:yes gene_type:complete
MTILLPLEIKDRELHAKLFLATKIIENSKFDVVIGEKNKVYNLFKHNTNVYLLSKGGPKLGFRFKKNKYRNNFLGILDEEGPILNLDKHEKNTRLHKNILNNIDDYFLWGKKDYTSNKKIFKSYNKTLCIYGHPKFDLHKKKNILFYKKEINQFKIKYKKFIFVASSFPVDQVMNKKSFNKFRFYNFEMGKKETLIKKNFDKYLEIEKNNYINLIRLLEKIAINNPDINIVFRPHPRQDIEIVKRRFSKKIKNIKIIYKDVITPWIAACDIYLHSGCSSFLEAASLEKKIIYFSQNDHEKKAQMYKEFGKYFNSIDTCFNFLKKNKRNSEFVFSKSKKPLSIIENSSTSKEFNQKFINYLKKNYSNKLLSVKNLYPIKNSFNSSLDEFKILIKKFILKFSFLENILFQLNASNILSNKYKIKKFPHLKKNEVLKYVFRSTKIKNSIIIEQLSKDLFSLRRNK